MTTDKTPATLATAKHGGCVQLGDGLPPLPKTGYVTGGDFGHEAHNAFTPEQMQDYARAAIAAALSAQPSPAGQGDVDMRALAASIGEVAHRLSTYMPHLSEWTDRARDCRKAAEVLSALAARQPVERSFQAGVAEWMGQCFLPSLYSNMTERGDRLLEEVLELLQAHGYDKARIPTLVDYVFGRPIGEPAQEVGGVMVTLAGYCWVAGLDMHAAGYAELARISRADVMAKIRAKQEAKNALHFDTPLPGNAVPPAQAVDLGRFRASVLHAYEEIHDGYHSEKLGSLLALLDSQAVGK